MLAACGDSDNKDSDTTPTDTTGSLSGEYYSANIGLDTYSTWIGLFSFQEKNGDTLDVEVLRESDQGPPEGAEFSLDYALDSNNALTISSEDMGVDNQGQVSTDEHTFLSRSENTGEGSLMLGVKTNVDTGNGTLDGDYFVALVHSPDDDGPNFGTGYYEMTFDGEGTVTPGTVTTDVTFSDYDGLASYAVTGAGELTLPVDTRELLGAVRRDGELFIAVDTLGSPEAPDNTYKSQFIGIQKSTAATDALFEGTWEYGCVTSANDNSSWDACSGSMTLDANGDGNWADSESGSAPVSLDINPNGTFAFDSDLSGIVTPSGDTMLIVSNKKHTSYGDYQLVVAIKRP